MASRPILARLVKRIIADGGEEYIFNQVIAGTSIAKIMRPYDVTRGMFYWWLKDGGDERADLYREAKTISAEAHADLAGSVFEDITMNEDGTRRSFDNADVSLAKARSDYHRFLARVRDRDQFGEAAENAVVINMNLVGDSHLNALRELGRMKRPALQIPEAEFETLAPAETTEEPSLDDLQGG